MGLFVVPDTVYHGYYAEHQWDVCSDIQLALITSFVSDFKIVVVYVFI
jgi:hypothetical protein